MSFDASKQCCFCGAIHDSKTPLGYAGEKPCSACGKGGNGEPDEADMYYRREREGDDR